MAQTHLNDLVLLLAQIAAIVVVSRVLGLVTRRLGQPLVIAEVLAGILLGPSLLGWLWPGLGAALFPQASLPTLKLIAQVGLVLFMFLIGLELDPKLLQGRTRASFAISHSSIVVPFALGAAVAVGLYEPYAPAGVSFAAFVSFLGVSMSVTAFPVLARILSERKLLSSRVGAIAIACAAVDDVTAWCLLAVVVALARAEGLASAALTTSLALIFIAIMLLVVRPFMQRVGSSIVSSHGLTPTVFAGIFVLLAIASIIAELIGVHALFGAFLFGAILPKEGKLAESVAEKLESVAVVLFLPLFFAYSGLRTQIGLVSGAADWAVTGLVIAAATLGKFGGSAVAGRLTGLDWREASAIGILMNTRGLMELIVLNIGLGIGVISPTVFTMLVLMALVTTFATTPILGWVYPERHWMQQRLPEPRVQDGRRTETVLACVADGTSGAALVDVAAALSGEKKDRTTLLALHLWPPSDSPSAEQRRAHRIGEQGPLRSVVERARQSNVDVHPLEFVSSEVGRDICLTAQSAQASLVLMGVHKPLLLEGSFGGVVRQVLGGVAGTVGVFMNRGLTKIQRVLYVPPCMPLGEPSASFVKGLRNSGIRLTLLHTEREPDVGWNDDENRDRESMTGRISTVFADPAFVAEVTLQQSTQTYDLVVVDVTDGHSVIDEGCQRIVAECSTSVLVLYRGAKSGF